MKPILVPLDFSDSSLHALVYAKYLAKSWNVTLHLLHVMNSPRISMHAELAVRADNFEHEKQQANNRLCDIQSGLKDEGFQTEISVETGFVADVIHDLEQNQTYSYIVMGTTGATGFVDRLIGSNATAVMNKVNSPLILIPHESPEPHFHDLVFCTQFQTDETEVLQKVFAFAHHFGSRLTLLKINADWVMELFSDDSHIKRIQTAFSGEKMQIEILKADTVLVGIDDYIESRQPGMLVMAVKRKSLIERLLDGSTSRRIAMHTRIPLLIYHH